MTAICRVNGCHVTVLRRLLKTVGPAFWRGWRVRGWVAFAAATLAPLAGADLAVPAWYDEGGGVADWHFRAPLILPGAAVTNSQVVVDVDFNALLNQVGVAAGSVDFDEASPRVVRSDGTLVPQQEFTDVRYGGLLDGTGNARGEVRFIQQAGTPDYYLYFDITANGVKPAAPVAPINGHFEMSAGATPTSWVTSAVNANGAQNNEVYRTAATATINVAAGCSSNAANGVDNGPNRAGATATGQAWHLLGYRNNCEDGSGNERIRLSRNIAVPAGGAAGTLTWFFQLQTFDGIQNNNNYDWITFYVNGTPLTHTALSIANATPPVLRIDGNRLGRSGYSRTMNDYGWKQATLNLAAFQGTTINFRIESRHSASDNSYRQWLKVDDVEWSRQDATLGIAEGFGVNVTTPADTAVAPATRHLFGETLAIAAVVDADPVSVTADLFDNAGALVVAGIVLFDDGTHGDGIAGDDVWTNDGSVPAEPTYTFVTTDTPGAAWSVRVRSPDASLSGIGATDGLVHRNGQPSAPEDQVNFHNVDEQTFVLGGAQILVDKTVTAVEDPGSGAIAAKSIPGARLRYDIRVTNNGPDATDTNTVTLTDELGAEVALCVTSACADGGAPFVFDDAASPDPTGLGFAFPADVSYSTDGSTWTPTASPDGGGYDAAIRFVRLAPTGAFNGPGVNGSPEFVISYFVRVN